MLVESLLVAAVVGEPYFSSIDDGLSYSTSSVVELADSLERAERPAHLSQCCILLDAIRSPKSKIID